MIKFYRKIRQSLIAEEKTGKYLKYAIGEIILVVAGILIALQINNWNEQRKQNILEQEYLIALKTEFENNVIEVSRVLNLNIELLEKAQELATYTGLDLPNITDEQFAELFFGVIKSEVQYRPGSGVLTEIINSGNLNALKKRELKNALAALDGLILRIRFQESEELAKMRDELISLGHEKMSLRKMAFDAFGQPFDMDKGRFLDSNLHMLKSKIFDNYITGFIYASGFLNGRYKALKEQLQEIIAIIDSQIK